MRALPLLLALLPGCTIFSSHDGTYLLTSRMTKDSCNPDNPQIGQESQSFVAMYHTGKSLVLDVGGTLLVGDPVAGGDFTVSYAAGSSTSYDGCDLDEENQTVTIAGTFNGDLGFDGQASSTSISNKQACPRDDKETCEYTYAVSAMKLDAARDRRPTGSIAWGYLSGGGY